MAETAQHHNAGVGFAYFLVHFGMLGDGEDVVDLTASPPSKNYRSEDDDVATCLETLEVRQKDLYGAVVDGNCGYPDVE
jgi:hypothetical protein